MTLLRGRRSGSTAALCSVGLYILLLCSAAATGDRGSAGSPSSGAEFLKNVMGNLQRKPDRRAADVRIDVEEYIPDDVPGPDQPSGVRVLTQQPGSNNLQANHPGYNEVESVLAQVIPQFFKNGILLSDTQSKIVNSQGSKDSQQFNPISSNSLESTGPQQFNPSSAMQIPQNVMDALASNGPNPDGTIAGYNYLFVPLDSNQLQQNGNGGNEDPAAAMMNPDSQMQAKPKVEPLFVAMAGFVGVAVIFLSAMMFIPRLPFHNLAAKATLKRAPEELASLTRLVAESIDGKDCSERIACEVGRAMRSMHVGSKPIRMMEIILPPDIAKQLAQIRRSALKKEQCHFITCKNT